MTMKINNEFCHIMQLKLQYSRMFNFARIFSSKTNKIIYNNQNYKPNEYSSKHLPVPAVRR